MVEHHQHAHDRELNIGPRWLLPSDHVPVVAEILGVRVASWNVLNSNYIHHIEKGDQGLRGSAIETEHAKVVSTSPFWSEREEHELRLICEILKTCSVLALQECSAEFLQRLAQALPAHYELRLSSMDASNQIATVLDRTAIDLHSMEIEPQGFPSQKNRQIVNMLFSARSTGEVIRLIHSHVPGNPRGPGLDEFASYVGTKRNGNECCVVMGDLNFPETSALASFFRAGLPTPLRSGLAPTTLGTDGMPTRLDHIFVFTNSGNEVLSEVPPEMLSIEFGVAARLLVEADIMGAPLHYRLPKV